MKNRIYETYWDGKGLYQDLDFSLRKLVPESGSCKTLEGETLRAIRNLYYDFYNNGFINIGCNRSYLDFLKSDYSIVSNLTKEELDSLEILFKVDNDYQDEVGFYDPQYLDDENNFKFIQANLEKIYDKILVTISERSELTKNKNKIDCLTF